MHILSEALLDLVDRPGADLAPVALLLARLEYPHVDAAQYLGVLESMGAEALWRIGKEPGHDAPLEARVDRLSRYLHVDMGFVGNRDHYEDPRNSCLNQVLDRRIGIPITLSVVYIEVARRAGLAAEGISFPGHFLARMLNEGGSVADRAGVIVDPFGGGAILHDAECRELLRKRAGSDAVLQPEMLASATRREIVIRMLYNLKRNYVHLRSFPQARGVTNLLVALMPTSATELRDRGLLAYHLEDFNAALRDLEAYLHLARPAEQDDEQKAEAAQTWEHVKALRRRVAGFN
jgi:regulator of sirC expression with transglutaminase-like and TPR domain